MNEAHMRLCSSEDWAEHIRETLMPWIVDDLALGDSMIEVGAGPGLTTDLLRGKAGRLTAVEYDAGMAAALAERLAGTNVEVVHADATDLPQAPAQFSAAACFTMLHHVPTVEQQDRVLAELARVLRPDGVLVGVDSLDSPGFRDLHEGDICVPIDPLTFADRLRQAGFSEVDLTVWAIGTRFVARKG